MTDLGTEFGVGVGPDGATQVQVFEGAVVAGRDRQDERRLTGGEAVEIGMDGGAARPLPFTADRFLRVFPEPADGEGGPLYNRGRVAAVEVPSAPGPVAVDGDLADWDLSGRFRSACEAPYGDAYHVEAALMHDARTLYVSARVGDPHPLANRRDAATDTAMVWQGGSVVLRLVTDPRLGWPLRGRPREGVAHLLFWYDAPRARPRLAVQFGLHYADTVLDPPGWRGAFVPAPDGRGYTLEAAVPWEVLRAKSPPRAGDETAAAFVVHWSDAAGMFGRGWLADCLNPAAPRYDMMDATTWGKAVFRGPRFPKE